MDALLQVIVPELPEVQGFEVVQPNYEWDGVQYPQGDKVLYWGNLSLSFDRSETYINRFLPLNYLNPDWIWLTVSDATLDSYEISINADDEEDKKGNLGDFLRMFLGNARKWVLVFLVQSDQIDNTYKLGIEDCISHLEKQLKRNSVPEGFIAFK